MRSGIIVGAAALSAFLSLAAAEKSFDKPLLKDQKIVHALARLTFGPRPRDIETVQHIGLEKWIDSQLHPDRIPENSLLSGYLETLTTLNLSPRQISEQAQNEQSKQKGKQAKGLNILARELNEAKLYRAIYSERQLEEQLVDFWFNHFNVNIAKGADRLLTASYERDAIRPHVWGKFRDLLGATAHHPAMLFYLDNWQSSTPEPQVAQEPQRPQRPLGPRIQTTPKQQRPGFPPMPLPNPNAAAKAKGKQQRRGINENYARELLELHTVGVDNGYTQQDIIEVARCFTGWTILRPQQDGEFQFNPRMHDSGPKTVLGVKIPAGEGENDGERVLDILAKRPETAHFISLKIAQRFVADEPPAALVDRMAKKFRDTDGDLRAVVAAMIASPEFFSEGALSAKVKTPLEFVVSAVRASEADVRNAAPLGQKIAELGQPLYRKVEPTGYSTMASEWINSASILGRLNFAVDLTANRIPGSRVDAGNAGLAKTFGSPEFQKR